MYSEPGKYACDFCIIKGDSLCHMSSMPINRRLSEQTMII